MYSTDTQVPAAAALAEHDGLQRFALEYVLDYLYMDPSLCGRANVPFDLYLSSLDLLVNTVGRHVSRWYVF